MNVGKKANWRGSKCRQSREKQENKDKERLLHMISPLALSFALGMDMVEQFVSDTLDATGPRRSRVHLSARRLICQLTTSVRRVQERMRNMFKRFIKISVRLEVVTFWVLIFGSLKPA